jgi:hypothetical protein
LRQQRRRFFDAGLLDTIIQWKAAEGKRPGKPGAFDEVRGGGHVRPRKDAGWLSGVERVRAVREAIGPEIELAVDCHGRFDVAEALTAARALEECDLFWFEEPVPHTRTDDLARITSAVPMATASAESVYAVEGFAPFLTRRVVDVIMPDVKHDGGLMETVRIAGALEMARQRRVALILVEAVGCQTFPVAFEPVDNTCGWYRYAVGDTQYLAIGTGRHFVEHPYPPRYRYELYDDEAKPYPFSGIFRELPPDAIGRRCPGRSAAVGARAVMTHAAFGADITIECFVRALYNHGVMATIHVPPDGIASRRLALSRGPASHGSSGPHIGPASTTRATRRSPRAVAARAPSRPVGLFLTRGRNPSMVSRTIRVRPSGIALVPPV